MSEMTDEEKNDLESTWSPRELVEEIARLRKVAREAWLLGREVFTVDPEGRYDLGKRLDVCLVQARRLKGKQ